MELAPRYCRTCGSRILVKNVCHNCNSDPLKGDNYCYDCGALTAQAAVCMKCGARFQKKFPVALVIVIGSLLVVAVTAAFFITRSDKQSANPQQQIANSKEPAVVENKKEEIPDKEIVNNPVDSSVLKNDNVSDSAMLTVNKPVDSALLKNPETSLFTSDELNGYKIRCTYFEKKQKNQVVFFIANALGYIKINGNVFELKRTRRNSDIAIYSGNNYEAIITISGLTGSAKEWLASGTLTVKDLVQKTSATNKIYSTCLGL